MTDADLSAPKPARLGVAVVVILLHIAAIAALIRAFAPDLTQRVAEEVIAAFTVTVTTPPPPKPEPKAPEPEGAAAPAGAKATPREVTAPRPKVAVAKDAAPPVASTGSANSAGARDRGDGTGAGGAGSGTGAGGSGSGTGAGGATRAEKIAGDINSRKDYPRRSEDARIGTEVIIHLTVGTDGRARNCRVHKPGGDPESDQITCRLAVERFRFRPATDAAGRPVESTYGWRQRWFYPGKTS
jgi:protein TonB